MAAPWYLPGTIFLLFIICCLVFLVLVYWKASVFLHNQEGGADIDEDEVSDNETAKEEGPATITYSKLKSFASLDNNSPLIVENGEEVEVIEHCTVEITLRYAQENNYLSGFIENIRGMMHRKSKRMNCIRFHIALLPSKKRLKTGYRFLEDLKARIGFCISNFTTDNLSNTTLRFRLYGRRLELGVPINREQCLGEAFIELNDCMKVLSDSEEVRCIQAILPKGQRFPSYDDDIFSDGT